MYLKHLHMCVKSKVYRIELFLNNDFMTRKCSCSMKIKNKFGLLNHSWNIEIEWVSEDQFRNGSKPSSKNAANHLCRCSNWTAWIWTLINLSERKSEESKEEAEEKTFNRCCPKLPLLKDMLWANFSPIKKKSI